MGEARVRGIYLGEPRQLIYNGAVVTPNVFQTLINHTIVPNVLLRVVSVVVVCRFTGLFRIKKNGIIIGSGRTGPGESNVKFDFEPYVKFESGDVLLVEFCSRAGIPQVDLEAYVHAGELTN